MRNDDSDSELSANDYENEHKYEEALQVVAHAEQRDHVVAAVVVAVNGTISCHCDKVFVL